MTNEELGRRAVACQHWRWMPGMQPLTLDEEGDWMPCERVWRTQGGKPSPPQGAIPDLTDAATLGCLLALVRAAWKDPGIAAVVASYDHKNGYQWRVVDGHHHGSTFMAMSQKRYSTEAEALVAALGASV